MVPVPFPSIKNLLISFKGTDILKKTLQLLIDRFGIELINKKLSDICYDKSISDHNMLYDDMSEAYDKINTNFFRLRHLKREE